jgi:putative flavoprotein involved in K+ transport
MEQFDVIVIGAGHAGLAISYHLKQQGNTHLVFERGRIGETWRSQRWDTFKLNSANKKNMLPGYQYAGPDGDGFDTATNFARDLAQYASAHQLPVREHARVISVAKPDDRFTLVVEEGGATNTYRSKNVVVASGIQNVKKVPHFAQNISPAILQLHTLEYRSSSQLPPGAVLVVGSAQSGVQIAEDLLDAGRKVYLATSKVGRLPRRYRGRDIIDWLTDIGFFDLPTVAADPQMLSMRVPQISGVGVRGKTISLQSLARDGATILGKIENADANMVQLAPNANEHVQFADGLSKMVKDMIDQFIEKQQLAVPAAEVDANDIPDPAGACVNTSTSLDLAEHNITSIIWTTGFDGDFSYINLPALDERGQPKHSNGIGEVEGLYFLGLPWLRMRKSGMIFGICDDAAFIAEQVLSPKS